MLRGGGGEGRASNSSPEEEETVDIDRGREGFLRAAATEMKERAFGSAGSQATELRVVGSVTKETGLWPARC